MAGSSDSEEGDYWPGYVDALTAMVKVLTFVMMLLAVAVFAISQKVSKSSIEQIAKAVNVEVTDKSGVNDLTAKVVAALKAPKTEPKPEPEKIPSPVLIEVPQPLPPVQVQPDRAQMEDEARKVALAELAKAAGLEQEAAANPDATIEKIMEELRRREMAERPAPQPVPAPAEAAPPPTPVAALEKREVESRAPPEATRPEKPADVSFSGEVLTLKFAENAVRLDDAATAEVKSYLTGKEVGRFAVVGYAQGDAGSLSTSRRVAFYRAMMVRQALIGAGLAADRIKVTVSDTVVAGEGLLVKVGKQ
jgi:outer membrane protein OmpA-like peptidoglycan-associated protein